MARVAEPGGKQNPAGCHEAFKPAWLNLLQCPVCFGKIEWRAHHWPCIACGKIYPSAGLVPDFLTANARAEGIEDDYERDPRRRSGEVQRLYHELRRSFQLELIRNEAGRLGRLLDIVDLGASDPTGTGTYHSRIIPLARTYLGVEPSLPLVQSAVPTAKVGVVRGSAEQSLVRANAVDLAICFSALDHCVDPDLVLVNVAKALRDGGCAMIELKNANAWYRPFYDHSPRWLQRRVAPSEHAHPWNFCPTSLTRRVQGASFRIVEIYDFLYFAPLLKTRRFDWIIRLLGKERSRRSLGRADAFAHAVVPGRGGSFMALARK
jgi:SAM-dependent methyltransferase